MGMYPGKRNKMRYLTELIGNNPLRALSWKEPYGSLMLQGKVETRTWPTNYRGWVLMCASKQPYRKDAVMRISRSQTGRINAAFGFDDLYMGEAEGYYRGYAFAVGALIDCRPMEPKDEGICYVDWYKHLYCHVYDSVQRIETIPWRGTQGWRTVSPDVIKKIILL